jgi:predicted Zn-ribbon and HTH transcriptional regulator
LEIFGQEEGLDLLEEEIRIFNGLNPIIKPNWLSSIENRKIKKHASAIISFETKAEAEKAIRNRLHIAGISMRTVKYTPTRPNQCKRCQGFDHSEYSCNKDYKCSICAKNHPTRLHPCSICKTKGEICPHTITQCINCQKDHQATDKTCEKFQALLGKELKGNRPEIFSHVEI